ncbi:MAG TPA: alpha/beta hydrolase [Holophagaceae bacterium]|nr:alpha/beta hydrolase [Holophagaceae bacterium]
MKNLLAPLLLCLTGCLAAAPQPRYRVQRALEYARHDGVSLTGDLYVPTTPGQHPALVAVHGGDWKFADASLYRHWGPYLARRGYALFAINYRLVRDDRHRYPAAVEDVRAAVQFLRGRGGKLAVDPDRLALLGDSAGAHLAALAALAADEAPFRDAFPDDPFARTSARVKACVAIYGVYDLKAQWDYDRVHNPDDNIVQAFLGATPSAEPDLFQAASPLAHVASGRPAPAFLLAWGTKDDRVDPATQSEAFAAALAKAGAFVAPVALPGAPHYWASDPITPGSRPAFLAPRLLRFLRHHL